MRFRWIVLAVIALSLVLSACGGGDGNGDDVTKPVENFFKGFEELDAEKVAENVCKEYRDDAKAGMEMIFGFLAMAGDDATIEITDLKLEAEDKSDNEATVVVTGGTMKMSIGGEVQEETTLTEGSEKLKVIKEDGKWVICDDAFLGELSP